MQRTSLRSPLTPTVSCATGFGILVPRAHSNSSRRSPSSAIRAEDRRPRESNTQTISRSSPTADFTHDSCVVTSPLWRAPSCYFHHQSRTPHPSLVPHTARVVAMPSFTVLPLPTVPSLSKPFEPPRAASRASQPSHSSLTPHPASRAQLTPACSGLAGLATDARR